MPASKANFVVQPICMHHRQYCCVHTISNHKHIEPEQSKSLLTITNHNQYTTSTSTAFKYE
eukprot:gene13173-9019_t